MKKINIYLIVIFVTVFAACDDMFDTENRDILQEEQIFSNADGVNSVLANIYTRIRDTQEFNVDRMTDWDDGIIGTGTDSRTNYGTGYQTYWDYGLIREISLFLENLKKYGDPILPSKREYFEAEARFMRAWVYFDLVKNMGGVPLILNSFDYEVGSNPADYQVARSKEVEIYDFILSELDEIKDKLDVRAGNSVVKNRATKGAALALKCRAMLYAGSIAKYTPSRPELNLMLPGGETGIPESKANEYYQKSLDAFLELKQMGLYKLYNANSDKTENFYEAITKKTSNDEIIFIKDYDGTNVKNWFTVSTIPRSLRVDQGNGSRVNPTLNLAESYLLIDGSESKFKTKTTAETIDNINDMSISDEYVIYDNPFEIFEGRDPRFYGTILTPGSKFKGADLSLFAGLAVWNGSGYDLKVVESMDDLGGNIDDKKYYDGRYMTGFDGPHATSDNVTRTGFLLRKYVDNKGGAETLGRSDMAYVRFRYGEMLLNAAEAAFELGKKEEALQYINEIRKRAGGEEFELKSLTSMEQIRYERRAELAFEDHRFYDVKRWRIGDKLFDGNTNTSTAVMYALWPYQIYRPGHESDGKYIYRRLTAPKKLNPLRFLNGNYYGAISTELLSNNKLLIKNPYQD